MTNYLPSATIDGVTYIPSDPVDISSPFKTTQRKKKRINWFSSVLNPFISECTSKRFFSNEEDTMPEDTFRMTKQFVLEHNCNYAKALNDLAERGYNMNELCTLMEQFITIIGKENLSLTY